MSVANHATEFETALDGPRSKLHGGGDAPRGEVCIMDPTAFHALHYPRLYRTACRILRDPDLAQDAVQDAFRSIFANLRGFRGESRLETWMTRIVVNASLGYLRKRKNTVSISDAFEEGSRCSTRPPLDASPDPLASAMSCEIKAMVHVALSKLKEIHRGILLLHDMQGVRLEAIASAMGLPVGTVKSRLFYGRRQLQRALRHCRP